MHVIIYIENVDINFSNILLDEKFFENFNYFQSMTFHTKPQQVQNHCLLGSIKQMDFLGFVVVNLDI